MLQNFYNDAAVENQFRMFQEMYLRQMIKILTEADESSESFYRSEIAQCYLKLAELTCPDTENPSDFCLEKCEYLELAGEHFLQAQVRITSSIESFF